MLIKANSGNRRKIQLCRAPRMRFSAFPGYASGELSMEYFFMAMVLVGVLIAVGKVTAKFLLAKKNEKAYLTSVFYEATNISYLSMRSSVRYSGENDIAAALSDIENARFIFNISIPGEDVFIDCVMLSKNGIFVFEACNLTGRIIGSLDREQWSETPMDGYVTREEDLYRFPNPVISLRRKKELLNLLLGEGLPVRAYAVFSDTCEIRSFELENDVCTILKLSELRENVASQEQKDALADEQLEYFSSILSQYANTPPQIPQTTDETAPEAEEEQ